MDVERSRQIDKLKEGYFDVVVIGGGATGAGIALDAVTRGLRVALVEKDDFASETSSRSTKLIHGGVRYLEAAFKRMDGSQFRLVYEALRERKILLNQAPYLARSLAIVLPFYSDVERLYYLAGLKAYDVMAGRSRLSPTRLVSRRDVLSFFPLLRREIKGGILYYDGSFDDARMNIAIIMSAIKRGAVCCNYTELVELIKSSGRVKGIVVRDNITKEQFDVRASVVVSATGIFTDRILKMDDAFSESMIKPSLGTHVVMDPIYTPPGMGLLIPKTSDGRLLFMLPWQDRVLLGTTDVEVEVEEHPRVPDGDVDYLLEHMDRYYLKTPCKDEIRSKWAGIRPLVVEERATSTAGISREHVIRVTPSGLVVIAGGKWTSYRKMAEDVVDKVVEVFPVVPERVCVTPSIRLHGAEHYRGGLYRELQDRYSIPLDIAKHLSVAYGDRAEIVAGLVVDGYGERLHPDFPYTEADVIYSVRNEMAQKPVDFLLRRIRLGFLDTERAVEISDRVSHLFAKEMEWGEEERRKAYQETVSRLECCP